MSYDSWLLSGSDDAPPYPPTPSEVRRAAAQARPFQVEWDCEQVGVDAEGWPDMRPVWTYSLDKRFPQNARALRLQARLFRRVVRQMSGREV